MDFEAAVIDGSFPPDVRRQLVDATREAISSVDFRGIEVPEIAPGTIGVNARAVGGASLPLFARYLLNQNVLFKEMES